MCETVRVESRRSSSGSMCLWQRRSKGRRCSICQVRQRCSKGGCCAAATARSLASKPRRDALWGNKGYVVNGLAAKLLSECCPFSASLAHLRSLILLSPAAAASPTSSAAPSDLRPYAALYYVGTQLVTDPYRPFPVPNNVTGDGENSSAGALVEQDEQSTPDSRHDQTEPVGPARAPKTRFQHCMVLTGVDVDAQASPGLRTTPWLLA